MICCLAEVLLQGLATCACTLGTGAVRKGMCAQSVDSADFFFKKGGDGYLCISGLFAIFFLSFSPLLLPFGAFLLAFGFPTRPSGMASRRYLCWKIGERA